MGPPTHRASRKSLVRLRIHNRNVGRGLLALCQVAAYFKHQFANVKEQKRAREPRPYDYRYILHKCQHTLGSVDISSQQDNEEDCTSAGAFVGVGSPNPSRESAISIVRLTIHNRTVGARSPRLAPGRGIFQKSIHERERAKAGEGTSPCARSRHISNINSQT